MWHSFKYCLVAIYLTFGIIASTQAADVLPNRPNFRFSTAEEGKKILTTRDEFVQRLSPFDRAARMRTDKAISEDAYLKFVSANVLNWTDPDKAIVGAVLEEIHAQVDLLSLPWPKTIDLIKTTGREEGGAPYTRGNAIVLPAAWLAGSKESLIKLIPHELFHILTRQNPILKERLYAAIGFKPCGEVAIPSTLRARKITNPDAPKNDHCIRLTVANRQAWAVPIIFATSDKYDIGRGGEFFEYLKFQFLLVDGTDAAPPSKATYDDTNAQLVDVRDISGFFEQVGKNTDYIIHPEEILADNFSLLILGSKSVRSPETIAAMQGIFARARDNQPNGSPVGR